MFDDYLSRHAHDANLSTSSAEGGPTWRLSLLPPGDLRDIFAVMRIFLSLLVLIGALWAIDTFAYGGRYGRAVWSEANYRGQMFRDEVAYRLRSINR